MFRKVTFLFLLFLITPQIVFARITPDDILRDKKEAYQKVFVNYSKPSQDKLTSLSDQIAKINKKRTDELSQLMFTQGEILDEYQKRKEITLKSTDGITRDLQDPVENARYWITYAHEAIAYQAAKIYVIDLSTEANLKSDAQSTINLFKSELESTRNKVIKSQKILLETLK